VGFRHGEMGASDSQTGDEHGRCQENAFSHDQMIDEITAVQFTCSGDTPEHWPSRTPPRLRVDWCCHVELVRRLGGPIRGLVH
jgi:hypothetical protein